MFRVAFLGRGRLGMAVLEGLLSNPNVEVPVVITCRATPEVAFDESRFAAVADAHGIPFFRTNNINHPEWVETLGQFNADLAAAMLWLHTISREPIETARLGFVNCHGGLLPKYRGNACCNWAILNGESEIGVTAHLMIPGELDNGPILEQQHIPIYPDTYIGDLITQIEDIGAELVLNSVEGLRTGTLIPVPQNPAKASFCYPRLPRDGRIDWRRPGREVEALVRATSLPYPGAYTYFADVRDGDTLKKMTIWAAHVERHPLEEFYAVPGHLLRLDDGARWGVVCDDHSLLVLDDIEIDDVPVDPEIFFQTVRQRFGLDVETHIVGLERRLAELEAPRRWPVTIAEVADRFVSASDELEAIMADVEETVEGAAKLLRSQDIQVEINPPRNFSFQKRFYDWEQRERWFGVQVYQSLRLPGLEGEPVALGAWYFSDDQQGLERRLYLSIKAEAVLTYSAACAAVFRAHFPDAEVRSFPVRSHFASAWYVVVPSLGEGASAALAQLATDVLARSGAAET